MSHPSLQALAAAVRSELPEIDGRDGGIAVRALRSGRLCAVVRSAGGGPPHAWEMTAEVSQWRLRRLFPAEDPRLPGARLLTEPGRLDRRLGPGRRVRTVEVVAWRPGTRVTARVLCTSGETLFLKLLGRRAFAGALATYQRLGADAALVRVTRPLLACEEDCMLVLPKAEGTALHEFLAAGRAPSLPALAAGLRAFAALPCAPTLPVRTPEDERSSALKMLDRGLPWLPELAPLRDRIHALPLPTPCGTALVHTDLHDQQVFVAGERLVLIDCEGMRRGDPRLDQVNLAEHLRLRALQGLAPATTQTLAAALDAELAGGPDPELWRYRALVRARLAGVYAQRTAGATLARRLATLAEECLTGP